MITQELSFKKMERRMREMEPFRFLPQTDLFPLEAMDDALSCDEVHIAPPVFKADRMMEKDELFIGRDRYLWLRKTVRLPEAAAGTRAAGLFDFGKTGGGHNSGFESLLYVNGEPYQGVDSNHMEVFFDRFAGQDVELTFMLWTGLEGGGPRVELEHRLRRAELCLLHEATDQLYYYAKAIIKTLRLLPNESPDREPLIDAMEAMLRRLDWDTDRFYDTVPDALAVLKERLAAIPADKRVTVNYVGHTHIDMAWLWRLKHTREKAIRSFSTVLRLMEDFDDYRFFQSQPQLYKYIKHDQPELYKKIHARIAEKRWEPDGGMWLEADCNISSGEALSRQFLYGIRFFEAEFGRRATCLWLPDVFGYSWALPQIMRQCGIGSFVTTKISWNQFNTIPNDLFSWRGIDGSEVLTYFIETPESGHAIDSRFATYNGQVSPRTAIGSWLKFKNKDLSDEVLVSYGYGDGGGGPNRNMLRMRQVMDELPGLPNVKQAHVGDFLARLHDRMDAAVERPAPVWDGELYLEYHRGTYTSQARNKRWNRIIENELAEAEMLAALADKNGMEYPRSILDNGWETLLRNQFHDIIPGSSIREVYEDSEVEYSEVAKALAGIRDEAFGKLTRPAENAFTLFSSGSFSRNEAVLLPVKADGRFEADGKTLSSQKTAEGHLVQVELKPLQPHTVRFVPGTEAEAETPFRIDLASCTAETPFYTIRWDENGALTRVYDRANDRETLADTGFGNRLEIYEDKPIDYENWDVDIFHTEKWEQATLASPPEVVECGALRAVIRFRYTYRKSEFTQDMALYAHSRRIDFYTAAEWHENRRLLKTAFATSVHGNKASYDIQYGFAERPTHQNTSWDVARFEVVGHKWADLSESNYGVSLLNNCKYGYSAKDGVLRLTLLKSGKHPDTEADMGSHSFTYSILPHSGSVADSETISEATALNLPVRVVSGEVVDTAAPVLWNSDALVLDAFKRAEDGEGWIVRLHECRGGSHRIKLESGLALCNVQPCNIMEEPAGEAIAPDAWDVRFSPFEIKTFRLLV